LVKQSEELAAAIGEFLRSEKVRLETRQRELEQEMGERATRVTQMEDRLRMGGRHCRKCGEQRSHAEVERARNDSTGSTCARLA